MSAAAGVDIPLLAMGANHGDLDNDGFPDAYIGTGEPNFATLVPNRMFLNDGGKRLLDVTTSGGFGHIQKGHGVAFGDIDNDGDQDVYAVLGGAYSGDVYPNALFVNPGSAARWVTLLLEGRTANRAGIGARIAVTVEDADGSRRTVHALAGSGGSFGASSLQVELGLGAATRIVTAEVRWPGDSTPQRLTDLTLDAFLRIHQGDDQVQVVVRPMLTLPSPSGRDR